MRQPLKLLAFVIACLFASWSGAGTKDDKPVLDKNFLIKVATYNHAAVLYSELAEKHAASKEVKDFANMVITGHKDLNKELTQIAKNEKVILVVGAEKEVKDEVARLSKLNGAEFDRAYLQRMIADHEKAIRMFEAQAKNGTDADLTALAKKTLPALKQHLKEAQDLGSKIK
jgi:putative membrane protein